jgi:hypothetical protein
MPEKEIKPRGVPIQTIWKPKIRVLVEVWRRN